MEESPVWLEKSSVHLIWCLWRSYKPGFRDHYYNCQWKLLLWKGWTQIKRDLLCRHNWEAIRTLFKETLPSIFLFPVYNQRSNLMWEKIIKCEHSGRHSKLWSLRSQLMTVDIQDAVMNSPIYREQPPANWLCLIITLTHLESKAKVY